MVRVAAKTVGAERKLAQLCKISQLGVAEGSEYGQAKWLELVRLARRARGAGRARVQRARQAPQLLVRQPRRAGRRQPPPQRASPEHHMPTAGRRHERVRARHAGPSRTQHDITRRYQALD